MARAVLRFSVMLAVGMAVTTAIAHDLYENGDDSNATWVSLSHGDTQTHDLDEGNIGIADDVDWMITPVVARHSYEARVGSSNVFFGAPDCADCAQVDRVNAGGTVLTTSTATNAGSPGAFERSVRWVAATSTSQEFIRVTGSPLAVETANSVYRIRFWDSTYAVPRWNNANGQVSVFLISSLVQAAVTGNVYFYNATGALLHTEAFKLGQNALVTINTATIPQLAGLSGHAHVAHTAGYGGLAGKAVALEPATGFSFDTPLVPVPH